MAIYILIKKVAFDSTSAEYLFAVTVYIPDQERPKRNRAFKTNIGRLRLNRVTGEINLVMAMPEDNNNRYFYCASSRVRRQWAAGELPDETCYAG